MEIMMAYIGKAHLDEFSDEKKWTILGLINKPGSHLETDIGVEFKMYSNEDLKTILLDKITNLQKQLSEMYPNEKVVRKQIQKNILDPNAVSNFIKTSLSPFPQLYSDEDPDNIIDGALSVHDSSDESEDDRTLEERNSDDEISANKSTQESGKEGTSPPAKKKRGRPKKSTGNLSTTGFLKDRKQNQIDV